tara:strand:- start:891 stop:1238 length:348 start_codon:yes stop_codon:yes gene_type:complete
MDLNIYLYENEIGENYRYDSSVTTNLDQVRRLFGDSRKEDLEEFLRINALRDAEMVLLRFVAEFGDPVKFVLGYGDGDPSTEANKSMLKELLGERFPFYPLEVFETEKEKKNKEA